MTSALDALGAEDLFESGAGEVLERTQFLIAVRNRVDAELARTARHVECSQAVEHDGLKSVPSWLRGHGLLAKTEITRVVRCGRALEHLPAVAAGFASGAITAAKVEEIAKLVTPDRLAAAAEQDIDVAAMDVDLARLASCHLFEKVAATVATYLARLDPDGREPDPTEGRRLSIVKHSDGTVSFRGDLDAVGGEKFQAAIESIVQANRPKGDLRTRVQQNADALVQLGDNQLAAGTLPTLRTVKPHVVVTVDVEDLVDPATGPGAARTGFGAVLSAARARMLACDSTVTRIVLGPDGLPLDVGRTQRVVPAHVRRAVENRDGHCVFTGCGAPTHWCDVHHLVHWIDDGDTSLDNSALLCERHHTQVHHGFRVVRDDGAPPGHRWRTYRPDDTEILISSLR